MGSYISIITLNVNGLNALPKDEDWVNGCPNMKPIYVVYKRPTSKQGTHTDWKWGLQKIFHTNRDKKKARIAILMSDSIDFKTKAVKKDKDTT